VARILMRRPRRGDVRNCRRPGVSAGHAAMAGTAACASCSVPVRGGPHLPGPGQGDDRPDVIRRHRRGGLRHQRRGYPQPPAAGEPHHVGPRGRRGRVGRPGCWSFSSEPARSARKYRRFCEHHVAQHQQASSCPRTPRRLICTPSTPSQSACLTKARMCPGELGVAGQLSCRGSRCCRSTARWWPGSWPWCRSSCRRSAPPAGRRRCRSSCRSCALAARWPG
jgi:hypothetical protein